MQNEFPGSQEVEDQDWTVSSLVRNLYALDWSFPIISGDRERGYTSGRISEEICAHDGAARGANGVVSEATLTCM